MIIGLDTVEPTDQKGCDEWDGEDEQKVTERHGITQSNYPTVSDQVGIRSARGRLRVLDYF